MVIHKQKTMTDFDKRNIYLIIQQSLSAISDKRIEIVSCTPYYAIDGTSGIKFLAKMGENVLPFFAGFSTGKKYTGKLLFGILKSERSEKIDKLKNFDEDENGNKIQEKFKINDTFLNYDVSVQKSKIGKWLSEQIQTVFILAKLFAPSYKNIGFVRWFIFVELPWLVFIGTSIFVGIAGKQKGDPSYFPKQCLILASISSLMIIFTIGFKKKVRKAKEMKFSLNPWSWCVSYTAKILAFCSFWFVPIIPHIPAILKFILTLPLRLFSEPCENCGARFSREVISQELLGTDEGYETITRHDVTRNKKGELLYTTARKEQVHVTKNYYRNYCRCKKCGYEWIENRLSTREG